MGAGLLVSLLSRQQVVIWWQVYCSKSTGSCTLGGKHTVASTWRQVYDCSIRVYPYTQIFVLNLVSSYFPAYNPRVDQNDSVNFACTTTEFEQPLGILHNCCGFAFLQQILHYRSGICIFRSSSCIAAVEFTFLQCTMYYRSGICVAAAGFPMRLWVTLLSHHTIEY